MVRHSFLSWLAFLAAGLICQTSLLAADDPADADIRAATARLVKAFDAGNSAEMAAMFLPQGELIDETGTIYQGQKELAAAFAKFFEKYPGAKLAVDVESVRSLGQYLAIEEGTRYVVVKGKEGDENRAHLRYSAVRVKSAGPAGQWYIASCREFTADPIPTPHERLMPLSWVVGDWINEGTDGVANISYRWTEDGNFLLADFHITITGKLALKSTQRIGWDPLTGKVRSWLFDSDGGFAEGTWTMVEDGWVVKSQTTNPDGTVGSATITISPKDKDHFTIKGTDRIIGDARAPDFEIAIARRPPVATK
ncbi:MAG: SgcJ/EcaC family oxidoreductase [Pirellulaceae bacterium]|nr:SgcJ/EcaC family oxidoreductase [Pirellulaceae bacterium]